MDASAVLSREFQLTKEHCDNIITLIDEGNTIPFIARYRKEKTGSIDDQLLREVAERLEYLRSLDRRRDEIEKSLRESGSYSEELHQKLSAAATLTELEDLYRPFRPKRRTRATIAKEKGLEPLAFILLLQKEFKKSAEELALPYINPALQITTPEEALSGARDIISEQISDDAQIRKALREYALRNAVLASKVVKEDDSLYTIYHDFHQEVKTIPGYRILAINRGEKEEILKVSLSVDDESCIGILQKAFLHSGSTTSAQIDLCCEDAWTRLLKPSIEREIRNLLTEQAGAGAIQVFGKNLHQLLMVPPVKGKVTLGVDPGFRTGCKLAVVDENGKVLATGIGHFTLPGMEAAKAKARTDILGLCRHYGVTAIAIGNGTASREAESFIVSLLPELPRTAYMIVSEAGASVYSASKLAAEEFPDYDVSLRSAVSIARRMQDPLAELVKIDPKAIGVGQYQHDLQPKKLEDTLNGVVESCVNSVGVEISTASPSLLCHVAGIGPVLAKNIVAYREENGISSRAELKKVPKLGAKAFEQCAGFLRVRDSRNVLDATAVHPESYAAANQLLAKLGFSLEDIREGHLEKLNELVKAYPAIQLAQELNIGMETLKDIVSELQKPGRDPRDELPQPVLRRDVLSMEDLKPGLELTGTVRNVIDFGAFVDIGVHQDGLVHISQMSKRYLKHPSEAVKLGDTVRVWVINVDIPKKRIALSMLEPETQKKETTL